MKPSKHLHAKHLRFGLTVLAIMLCTACGTKIIRGESPLVRMTELSHQDSNITLQVSMRNINGVPLDIQSIDFSLSVDDKELFAYQGPAETNIIANGTETWSVEVEESQSSRDLLDTLENGDVKSLPYSLKGSVISKEDGTLRFQHEGHIYPLPGRPGHFR
jgi:outer membrane lipoprotein-sorting protein